MRSVVAHGKSGNFSIPRFRGAPMPGGRKQQIAQDDLRPQGITARDLAAPHKGEYVIYPRDGYPLLSFHPDTRMTMIGLCEFEDRSIRRAGFIPCLINAANQPVPLTLCSVEGRRVLAYMRKITGEAGLATQYARADFRVGGCEAVIAT